MLCNATIKVTGTSVWPNFIKQHQPKTQANLAIANARILSLVGRYSMLQTTPSQRQYTLFHYRYVLLAKQCSHNHQREEEGYLSPQQKASLAWWRHNSYHTWTSLFGWKRDWKGGREEVSEGEMEEGRDGWMDGRRGRLGVRKKFKVSKHLRTIQL